MNGNQQALLSKGANGYGKAMRQLAKQLAADPNACYDNGNFLATMALHLYEVCSKPHYPCYSFACGTDALFIIAFEQLIMGTDLGGWIHHARGMARLMEIRGPHRFKEYPEHG